MIRGTSTTTLAEHATPLPLDILRRFDTLGPRYTSYPTADRFIEAFDQHAFESWLHARRVGPSATPLSLYVHIPFCASLCHYCACNKIITRNHANGALYLQDLSRELALHRAISGRPIPAANLHLGGGTPTFLGDQEIADLLGLLGEAFVLQPGGERSIEIDPRTVNGARMERLHALGFDRASFGVQDFDPEVQEAVHRVQSTTRVFEVVNSARHAGFRSINVDLIYGLPRQTPRTFTATLDTLCALRPDRVALYGYAHLPERFKPQRRILAADLPVAEDKLRMLSMAIQSLLAEGYVHIGMDHFALPEDSLAIARRQGRLHRNFQGYTDQPDSDLIGLGVSAISKVGPTYSQNAKTLAEYRDLLDQERLPVVRGIELTSDDVMRRAVITGLMCQGRISIEAIEIAYLVDFHRVFASELEALREFEACGLVECTPDWIQVTERGWYVVRAIAMVFDRYLQAAQERARFSRIL